MIIKVTGYSNEEPEYYRLYDSKENEIKDSHSELMIINILKGIQYAVNEITDELGPQEGLGIEFYSINEKINKYKKILRQIGFWIEFKKINQESVVEF